MKYFSRTLALIFVWIILPLSSILAQSFSYSNEPLLSVIEDIEEHTSYRFLYREALISDIKVSLNTSEEFLMAELTEVLSTRNIGLKIDESRRQALIYKAVQQQSSQDISISGHIVDSETGERLPFATITWRQNGEFKGIAATSSGSFNISFTSTSKAFPF